MEKAAKTAFGLAAFADKVEKPRYKPNGELCTAEEAAAGANAKERPKRGEPRRVAVDCLTKTQWNIAAGAEIEQQSAESRYRVNQLGRGYGYPACVQPPPGVSAYGLAQTAPRFP